jgi:hypothetical protein
MINPDLMRVALFKYTGGDAWRHVSTIQEGRGTGETELLFLNDLMIAVSRRGNRALNSLLSTAWPPYRQWYQEDLPIKVNGPGMGFVGPQPILAGRDPRYSPEIHPNWDDSSVLTVYLWDREGFEKTFEMEKAMDLGYPQIEPMPEDPDCSLMVYYVEDEVRLVKLKYTPIEGRPQLKMAP